MYLFHSSEIKELKVLLRLSPPDTMVNNNNRRDSLQSIPEPTEFEVRHFSFYLSFFIFTNKSFFKSLIYKISVNSLI